MCAWPAADTHLAEKEGPGIFTCSDFSTGVPLLEQTLLTHVVKGPAEKEIQRFSPISPINCLDPSDHFQ